MSRRGENIYKRKDGRWEARYIKGRDVSGKAKYGYIYAKTYSKVKSLLADRRSNVTETESASKLPYRAILNTWLEHKEMNVKESTKARYTYLVERYINPAFGNFSLDSLTTERVEEFVRTLLLGGRAGLPGGLSAKTVNDILMIVKATIKYAAQRGHAVFCNLDGLSVKVNRKEIRVLTPEEQRKLTRWLTTDPDASKLGILLSLYTGIRVGELCALQWKHIRLSDGMLLIRATMQRIQQAPVENGRRTRIIITEPKSNCSNRDIPLPAFLMPYFEKMNGHPDSFFLTGDRERFVEPRTMQNRFKKYTKLCGIPQVNYHALRHTFATHCVELGFEIKSLSEILGHANVNITLNKYVHSSAMLKRSNMEKLSLML